MKAALAGLALTAIGLASVPAQAEQPNVCSTHTESIDLADIRTRLQGPNITSVERWGGCLRVTIRNPSGRLSELLVDPLTLQVVPNGVIVPLEPRPSPRRGS